MSTVQNTLKLEIILDIAYLFKEKIDKLINLNATEPYAKKVDLLKELETLRIDEFIKLSKPALSKFNASICENSPSIIPVNRIIEAFTEIQHLINSIKHSLSVPKIAFFPSADKKIDLQKLKKNLTAINEAFNMLPRPTSDATDKRPSPALGA